MTSAPSVSARWGRKSTIGSLLGLLLGLIIGNLLHVYGNAGTASVSSLVESLGTAWARSLQMVAMPLVVTQLLVAVVRTRGGGFGKLGGGSLALFLVLLVSAGGFTLAVTPPVLHHMPLDPAMARSLDTVIPDAARQAADHPPVPPTLREWIPGLIPVNPLRSAMDGDILQVMIFIIVLGLAVSHLRDPHRAQLSGLFEGLAQAVLLLVQWILKATPFGVFALSLMFSRAGGAGTASVLAQFALLVSAILFLFTLLLYPVGMIGGRVSLPAFARALYPGQMVGLSTRSSLASLPALIESGSDVLRLPSSVTGFVLPFAAAVFKINRPISSTIKLLFVAALFDVTLAPAQILTFMITVLILSFSTVGIPGGGGSFKTLPAYLAAGLPLEGVVLMEAVDVIPDIFKTVLNVTGYMTAGVIMARLVPGGEASSAPEAAALPEGQPG